jgi:hypothetical protein
MHITPFLPFEKSAGWVTLTARNRCLSCHPRKGKHECTLEVFQGNGPAVHLVGSSFICMSCDEQSEAHFDEGWAAVMVRTHSSATIVEQGIEHQRPIRLLSTPDGEPSQSWCKGKRGIWYFTIGWHGTELSGDYTKFREFLHRSGRPQLKQLGIYCPYSGPYQHYPNE